MKNRKITSIDDLSAKDIHSIAELAIKFKKSKKRILGKKSENTHIHEKSACLILDDFLSLYRNSSSEK